MFDLFACLSFSSIKTSLSYASKQPNERAISTSRRIDIPLPIFLSSSLPVVPRCPEQYTNETLSTLRVLLFLPEYAGVGYSESLLFALDYKR